MPITAPPTIPLITDPSTFSVRAQDWVVWQAEELYPALVDASLTVGLSLSSVSTTSNTVGTGSKSFTVETGKGFAAGQSIVIADSVTPTNRMFGVVDTYNSVTGALVFISQAFEGSGTLTDWTISPTLNAVLTLVQIPDGLITNAKLDNDYISDLTSVTFDHANDYVAIADGSDTGNKKKAIISAAKLQPISVSFAANAMTITLNPTSLDFRDTTTPNASVNTRLVTSPISLTISSGSTLGTINGVQNRIVVLAIDNAGTVELAAVNLSGGVNIDETLAISTTAEGGAGGADSANVIYSNAARSNVTYRVVGIIQNTQATAGLWATPAGVVQGFGGQSLSTLGTFGFGQTWQNVTGSRTAGTTYYNATGKPIICKIVANCSSGAAITGTVWGNVIASVQGSGATLTPHTCQIEIPPYASYSFTSTSAPSTVFELR